MKTDWAVEQLQTIRTLMERSSLYRRALAPVMTLAGAAGLVAGVVAYAGKMDGARWFVGYWLGVAVVTLVAALLLIRRQAFKESEPLWSPPTRRVAQAMALPLFAGAVLSALFLATQDDMELCPALIVIWMMFYGFALNAAGFFVQRGIRLFGWVMALASMGLLAFVELSEHDPQTLGPGIHLLMGGLFGVSHLAYGGYLYSTEKKG
jgi:tetrahydromethanopterin S-methyltransferase subunit B